MLSSAKLAQFYFWMQTSAKTAVSLLSALVAHRAHECTLTCTLAVRAITSTYVFYHTRPFMKYAVSVTLLHSSTSLSLIAGTITAADRDRL
jgi:hypothetical protein